MLGQSWGHRLHAAALCAVLALAAVGCSGDQVRLVEGVIDRDTFIETYVDLRIETLQGPESGLTDEQRDQVLALHGVTAESLLGFVDAYGRELEYMNEVWSEIERRFEAHSSAPETTEDSTRS